MKLTAVRRRILQNVYEGKDPYDGFTGSQLGGAIRSVHLWGWSGGPQFIGMDRGGNLRLTPAGVKALEEAP